MKVGKKVMKLFDGKVEIFKRIEKTLRIAYNVIDIDYSVFGNQTCILIHDTVNINNQYYYFSMQLKICHLMMCKNI